MLQFYGIVIPMKRTTVSLPDKTATRMWALRKTLDVPSISEVLRWAIYLLQIFHEETEAGNEIVIRRPDGSTERIRMME